MEKTMETVAYKMNKVDTLLLTLLDYIGEIDMANYKVQHPEKQDERYENLLMLAWEVNRNSEKMTNLAIMARDMIADLKEANVSE